MQDIDFSRYYRHRHRRPYSTEPGTHKSGAPVNKVSLYLAIAFSSLAIGFIGGTQLQKNKMMRELENRVAPDSMQGSTIATANVGVSSEQEAEKSVGTVRATLPEETPRLN